MENLYSRDISVFTSVSSNTFYFRAKLYVESVQSRRFFASGSSITYKLRGVPTVNLCSRDVSLHR